MLTDTGRAVAEVPLTIDRFSLCSIFGVTEPAVAISLLNQLLTVLQPGGNTGVDNTIVDEALGLIKAIGPTDAVEAMISVMLIATQRAAIDTLRRGTHTDQTPGGRQMYLSLALKATRTAAQLIGTLHQGRGKCTTQHVIVERVNVEAGGQAIVGTIRSGGGG